MTFDLFNQFSQLKYMYFIMMSLYCPRGFDWRTFSPGFFQLLRTKGWYVLQNQKHVRVRPLRSRLGALHKTTKRWLLSTGTLVPFLLVSGDPVHPLYSWQPFGEKMVTTHGGAGFSALCPPTGKRYVNWRPEGNTVTSWQNTCILVEKSD